MDKKLNNLDNIINKDSNGKMSRQFYHGHFSADDIESNFVHICLTYQGGAMAKLNRKDIDSLIDILKELAGIMDKLKEKE